MLQSATIQFLKGLQKNNNKPWFEKNRATYESGESRFCAVYTNPCGQAREKR